MDNARHAIAAQRLVEKLRLQNLRLALAESCTGGMAAALLATVPGISNYFCGSAVTYRTQTKANWLGIATGLIEAHTPESPEISAAMALAVLDRTPEAEISAAVTGHLGPGAPPEKDGIIYVACALSIGAKRKTDWQRLTLATTDRAERQKEAADRLLEYVAIQIDRI